MQYAVKAAFMVLVISLTAPVAAQDIDAGLDAFERSDFAAALVELRPLAEQGEARAQFSLGIIYRYGLAGVPHDSD